MQSIKEIYRIGRGPSSSHTMGPEKACEYVMEKNIDCDSYKVTLYGSLSYTGKGHGTDRVIRETLDKPCEVSFNYDTKKLPHPNTLDIEAIKDGKVVFSTRVLSVGGGKIKVEGEHEKALPDIYELNTLKDISEYCTNYDMTLWQYVEKIEGEEIYKYMEMVWDTMKDTIRRGLKASGILPGGLNVERKAKILFEANEEESESEKEDRIISAYSYALAEENAASNMMVTSPTCGASGVVPSVLFYYQEKYGYSDRDIIHALYTGGLIGNIIKENASISGAECGCQAEIGSACAMAAAALSELLKRDFDQIDYASEIALEHFLGLTCDPIDGLVQIPCIERNAVASIRAVHAVSLSKYLAKNRKMDFDDVVLVMKKTGLDLKEAYRETAKGGLAKIKDFKAILEKRITRRSVINKY